MVNEDSPETSEKTDNIQSNRDSNYSADNFYCRYPFHCCEIVHTGDIYTCCRFHLETPIGNLFKEEGTDIWNSDAAIKIRKSILDQSYSFCNLDRCPSYKRGKSISAEEYENAVKSGCYMEKGPKHVTFTYDRECNAACIFCRDKVIRHTNEELQFYNQMFEKKLLPMLKGTETVTINANGDAFASRHSRYAIKRIHETYPDIRFEIFTNGILFNEYNIKELGIENNIYSIKISVHAVTKKTYSKIIKNGQLYWDSLIKNLNYVSNLAQKNNIDFYLLFVVTALNYKEIPDFVKFARNLNAKIIFSEYIDSQNQREQSHPEYIIAEKSHKEYKDLIKVLNHPIIDSDASEIIGLSPLLKQIQSENYDLTETNSSPEKNLIKSIIKKIFHNNNQV